MTGSGGEFMTVEFRVMLPADVTALARLSGEIDAVIRGSGLTCSPPSVRGAPLSDYCCDLHGRNCEPPSELCCQDCTEADHPAHRRLGPCSNPDLSAKETP